jgi:hypothetical protein
MVWYMRRFKHVEIHRGFLVMKHINIFIILVALVIPGPAWSLAMTDVGDVDLFRASTTLSDSSDAAEEAWVESILGFDVSLSDKYDSGGSDWTLLDNEDDVYATALDTSPNFFLIKLGTGGTSIDSHYLFENIGDLDWGVVDFSVAGVDFSIKNIGIDRLSHVDEFDEHAIPEPSILALIGFGLVGLAFISRRRNIK